MSSYLDLLEKCLLGTIYNDPPMDLRFGVVKDMRGKVVNLYTGEGAEPGGVYYVEQGMFNPTVREKGLDWPATAHTMIGAQRLRQLREACISVIAEEVPGDFIECGVWRGGACILMKAVLHEAVRLSVREPMQVRGLDGTMRDLPRRRVFVADSFAGLPPPSAKYPADRNDIHHLASSLLAVSEEQVKENFRAYGLLDEHVVFLKGWFKDTLPTAPIEKLAILRLDGDMYESTIDALVPLYDKVSSGGYVIVDDYFAVKGCQQAIDDFHEAANLVEPLVSIDGKGVYWRKK